jgi:hypothetical protein
MQQYPVLDLLDYSRLLQVLTPVLRFHLYFIYRSIHIYYECMYFIEAQNHFYSYEEYRVLRVQYSTGRTIQYGVLRSTLQYNTIRIVNHCFWF